MPPVALPDVSLTAQALHTVQRPLRACPALYAPLFDTNKRTHAYRHLQDLCSAARRQAGERMVLFCAHTRRNAVRPAPRFLYRGS